MLVLNFNLRCCKQQAISYVFNFCYATQRQRAEVACYGTHFGYKNTPAVELIHQSNMVGCKEGSCIPSSCGATYFGSPIKRKCILILQPSCLQWKGAQIDWATLALLYRTSAQWATRISCWFVKPDYGHWAKSSHITARYSLRESLLEGKNATPGIRRGCSHDSDWSVVDDKKCSDHFASLIVAFPCDNSKLLTPTPKDICRPRYKNKKKKNCLRFSKYLVFLTQ